MIKNYKDEGIISGITEQHNIMIFIGNGFDISALSKYRDDGLVPSYSKFFDFLCYVGFDENNLLFEKMKDDRDNGKENWSDFECSLGELLQSGTSTSELEESLTEIQSKFLLFLNEIVTPQVLLKLNGDITKNKCGMKALSEFLGDLDREDYEKIHFPEITGHYHMYNFIFINFNYTSLFDDYIYLDKYQFEPHPYKTVDTNFTFLPNPNGYRKKGSDNNTIWSSFVMLETIHPHGYQSIPRSLLFGVENDEYAGNSELRKFNKSYWAQCNQKYKSYFGEVKLFIIYGMSIGETDKWWWKNVYECLLAGTGELIIYYYDEGNTEKENIKQRFIEVCKTDSTDEDICKIKEKIFVVLYGADSSKKMFAL